jgi:endonuclease/exonuclease/phosphatase (EEP) superfamily protein YafD
VHHTYKLNLGPKNGGLAICVRGPWVLKSGSGLRFVDDEDWYYVATEVEGGELVFNMVAVHLTPYDYAARRLQTGVLELASGSTQTLTAMERSGEQVVKGQSDQAAALLARVERFKHPTVVAGDFNSTRDAALHTSLRETLLDAWERGGQGFGGTIDFVSWVPLRVDYVYASDAFAVGKAVVLQVGCSDHRPVVSDLVLRSVVEEL